MVLANQNKLFKRKDWPFFQMMCWGNALEKCIVSNNVEKWFCFAGVECIFSILSYFHHFPLFRSTYLIFYILNWRKKNHIKPSRAPPKANSPYTKSTSHQIIIFDQFGDKPTINHEALCHPTLCQQGRWNKRNPLGDSKTIHNTSRLEAADVGWAVEVSIRLLEVNLCIFMKSLNDKCRYAVMKHPYYRYNKLEFYFPSPPFNNLYLHLLQIRLFCCNSLGHHWLLDCYWREIAQETTRETRTATE